MVAPLNSEFQPQMRGFFEACAGQVATLERCRGKLGSTPLGVVEIAAAEAGVEHLGGLEDRLPGAAALPRRQEM
jgi:hypothetical protein